MTDWYQQSLTPPSALECRLRLGLVPERDHAQVMVELYEPSTKVLIGAWSIHAARFDHWQRLLEQAIEKAQQMVGDAVEPF